MNRAGVRLIDANANRALEGVRVCEDIVRFHVEASRGFRQLRALRHGIAQAVARLPVSQRELLQARGSQHDVGRQALASRTSSLEQALVINFQRVKESLRVLEECARVFAPRHTARFQQLRFRTYDLERAILLHLAALRHS